MSAQKPQIGMIGLAVMGSNLARNIESRGFPVGVYNRTSEVTKEFVAKYGGGSRFVASYNLHDFVASLDRPRQIIIMVKAGAPVDALLDQLLPLLDKGDIVIDGGNALFRDTIRREARCAGLGIHFLGIGISGGEEGALKGPSLMPGGPKEAWQQVNPILEKIAAQADGPCTTYIGPNGAGHYVKMVHNGIEYGDMQLIAESYDVLRQVVAMGPDELACTFDQWNEGVLQSYLIEITGRVFKKSDPISGVGALVDKILDRAGQKGTGTWTVQSALELGVSVPTIAAAVDARTLSSIKDERVLAASNFDKPPKIPLGADRRGFVAAVHDALYCAKIFSYAQGMALLRAASKSYAWDLQLGSIAAIWKGGCIIRARFLDDIRRAYHGNPELANLVLDPFMKGEVKRCLPALRRVVCEAVQRGIPVLGLGSSLGYFESYRTESLPQNLTQAQRDFFGAHTYERVDIPGTFHTEWDY